MSTGGFKAQLKDVLSNAVTYFQDSGDPNAACVKAANEAGFNADQADRLVETFNTARVICHYKAAEDKTSACSLASKETVRGQLTTPAEKTAAATEYDTADYGCYKQAEVDYVVPEVKVAAAELKEEPLSKEAADWLAVREASVIADCVKTAAEEARAANAMADELAEKVAMQLSRNVSLTDVHDRMARLVTAYALDERYAPGVEKVAAFLPEASDPDITLLKKYASRHVIPTDDLADVLPAIKEAADFVAEAAGLLAYAETMKAAQAAPLPQDVRDATGNELKDLLMREQVMDARNRRLSPVTLPKALGGKPSGGGGGGGSSGGSTASFLTYLADTAKQQYDADLKARVDKATEGVNNVRRQLILQDLLVRDKVLSQEDPNAVAAAYRSIHQISPDSTLNKEVLRSMLRSVVQSVALSPYDAKTLVDVDKTRRQAYEPNSIAGGKNHD